MKSVTIYTGATINYFHHTYSTFYDVILSVTLKKLSLIDKLVVMRESLFGIFSL